MIAYFYEYIVIVLRRNKLCHNIRYNTTEVEAVEKRLAAGGDLHHDNV